MTSRENFENDLPEGFCQGCYHPKIACRCDELLGTPEEYDNKLHAARHAFHAVRRKVYGDAVLAGHLTLDQAEEHYHNAMINYDMIIENAGPGYSRDANQEEMDKGFRL